MTREEAITILDCERPYGSCGCGATDEEIEEALDMAIEALEQKPICPSAGIDCEDCPAYEPKILNKWIGAEVLDRIRNEISERSRMHMDGDLYIKTSDCMQIIDEFTAEEDKA